MRIFRHLFYILLLFVFGTQAQERNISGRLTDEIPVDPDVRVGKLENGLTYYIRKNSKPEKKIEFRLVVNAGSILEDEDQLGLAHFTEHMAFNGSKNFQKNELVNYLQSIGVEFGADLNAYTSFDETVYMLPIPTDDPAVVKKGLQVLEDWAHQVSFTDEEIDKERGVVLEEWRLGRGASQRMRDQWFPIMFKNSHYADRLPIGTREVIENASYETVRQFYKEWYRPDLMAVIAVGDLELDNMEQMIHNQFNKIQKRTDVRERKIFDVPDHEETYVAIARDKEAPFTQIQLITKMDMEESKTLFDFRKYLVYQLYNGMLGRRMNELKQSSDPPFIFGGSGYGSMVRSKSNYSSFAMVGENGIEKGLRALVVENQRVKQHGFTPGELDRYKKEMLNSYEKAFKEKDKSESAGYAAEYVRSFLTNEPIPGRTFEYEFANDMIPGISLEEVNALASRWVKNTNRVVVITAPDKEGVTIPNEDEVLKMLALASSEEIAPYDDGIAGTALMETKPTAGKVISADTIAEVGVTELNLSNGIKVVLKPTDFKNDEILMSAYSPGGHSLYRDEDYYSASYASNIISQSGVRSFSPTDLQKLFAGKNVRVSPYIAQLSEGFSGNAAPEDLESMFQLIHLFFTDPRKDEKAFKSLKSRNVMLYENLMSNPQYYFQDQVSKIMNQNHPRGGGFPTVEDLEKIDFEKAYGIYKDRFSNAGDFVFFFVGNFEIDKIIPLINTYLASLPNTGRKETWKDLGIRSPKGVIDKVIKRGEDPKSFVSINYTGDFEYSRLNNYQLSSLGQVLNNRLIDIIREEKSGVYTVKASGSGRLFPIPNYFFGISFPCGPENVEKLVAATLDEIKNIKENGVSEEDVNEIKEAQRIDRTENLKKNTYWLSQLRSAYYHGFELKELDQYNTMVDNLTANDIKHAANTYLSGDNKVKIVLMPDN
ncbi:insulinase family protein [Fulvivirgaceae bacterium BMA12]|uniref:Insulinase family protein n=1 Tax=Agaribacillus aureus TaxID=3051825 RepID=A0ABT8L9C5_9BACT|nr:insulinase family protein [Fulvivirgaceae bacterium BMA12]